MAKQKPFAIAITTAIIKRRFFPGWTCLSSEEKKRIFWSNWPNGYIEIPIDVKQVEERWRKKNEQCDSPPV